jgi:hypothetical protein
MKRRIADRFAALQSRPTVSEGVVERVARAIDAAQCKGREGPFGGYDYGHNADFYGPAPEGGRYVVRDFRDPASPDYGKWVHQTNDRDEHERVFARMTEHHIARAAIAALQSRVSPQAGMREALEAARRALSAVLGFPKGAALSENALDLCEQAFVGIDAALSTDPIPMSEDAK